MNFIWIAITSVLGLVMFLFVRDHFIWSIPYMVIHLSLIAFLRFRGVLNLNMPIYLIPLLFVSLQLIYSIYFFGTLDGLGLDEENHDKEFKMNLIRIGLLVVEYPLLIEFFKKPKYNRY
jgi:hypothetical protein